jgi:hypothetical protein
MTGFENVAPEQLAKLFYHYREALAPDFECTSKGNFIGGSCWESADSNVRSLMVATSRLVLLELAYTARQRQHSEVASGDTSQNSNRPVEGTEGKECGC